MIYFEILQVIPYYTLVKPCLPTEFGIDFSGIDGTNPYELIHCNSQGSVFPFIIKIQSHEHDWALQQNPPISQMENYWGFPSKFICDFPGFGYLNISIDNISKKTFPVLCTNRDTISSIPSIIPGL